MDITINESTFKSSFEGSKDRFQHNKGTLIKLFPFPTERKDLPTSDKDLSNFHGIAGKFNRMCLGLEQTTLLSKADLIESICKGVDCGEYKSELENIINEIIFDKSDNLVLFSHQVLPYLNLRSPNAKLKNLQNYICKLFIDDDVLNIIKDIYSDVEETNIFYKLILEQLKNSNQEAAELISNEGYYQGEIVMKLRGLFKQDLKNLALNPVLFTEKISTLLKFYYFTYILEMTWSLNSMFDEVKPLVFYFSLEWEKLSKSRLAMDHGWKKLEALVEPMFAHANCLELLHTIDFKKQNFISKPFIYGDILQSVKKMDEESEKAFTYAVTKLIIRYKESIKDVNWEEFETKYKSPTGSTYLEYYSLSLIHKLFNMIKFQFDNSVGRNNAYKAFSAWYKEFGRLNYQKIRGSLGGTLKIDKETLLLFTELSILSINKEKILTSHLWLELEKRGIMLDKLSKREVIQFFEKINILEKKSDSGDAQYITRLHK